ncbi:Polyisoprenoid-binding protein YceI [Chitinophaga costaii]|uniref:Polyisoprenoid-binding protein YceI n=1 Tax=Chitinophaga costaii TaxID=1335309 RepID=A0A1C3ZS33_9BACT|nr:YceI family protein [Chitinophaga costaii]PUZ30480.1 polyisoprenoid-binding protein [Chitinophaga costaii]SCB85189.1 Polyisoprenoid-binding protein YceI [Chitinophaga costaii]
MKKLLFSLLALAPLALFAQTNTWTLDPAHSAVKFDVTHLVISSVEGRFNKFTGGLTANKPDFSDAQINFSVDVNSINTDNEGRDKHLKTDEFFNVEKYPNMTFKSTAFKKVSGNKYTLVGDLTIRDVTKKVTFDVVYGGTAKDPWGNMRAGFKATSTINRFDYNLKWDKATEAGGMVVDKIVNITLTLEFVQGK